jgi:hypothetical protein
MTRIRPTELLVVLVLVFVAWGFVRTPRAATRIQYKVVSIDIESPGGQTRLETTLNQLGAQGWDLTDHEGALYMFTKQD